jgi:hypothetical protein
VSERRGDINIFLEEFSCSEVVDMGDRVLLFLRREIL